MNEAKIVIKNLNFYYGDDLVLRDLNLAIAGNEILSILGPAKSGVTTLLRSLNRLCDLIPDARVEGEILLDGKNILDADVGVTDLRRRVGMVFDIPAPLPMTIFDNVAYGLRLDRGARGAGGRGINAVGRLIRFRRNGIFPAPGSVDKTDAASERRRIADGVENALRNAALWDDVKDRLHVSATSLSGGQQQRLCIARVLALDPEVVLLDRPCSGLDPISTANIEDSLLQLKERLTVIIAPHNVQQAARISDRVAFMLMGELVEEGANADIFSNPKDERTSDFITGRFG